MRTLLLLLLLSFNCLVLAQTTTAFRINYDQALLDLPGNATESLTSNQYIFAGTNVTFLPYGTVTELDANGDLIWSKSYSDGSFGFQLNDIKKDQANSEYYVCGGSESNAGVFMRLDATGNVVVSTRFEIAEADGAYLNRVIKTSDGGYIAAGYVTGHDPDGGGPETYFAPITYTDNNGDSQTDIIGSPLLVKFDANGNHLWHHVTRYYTTVAKNPADRIYNDASFRDVVETADGYMAVGQYDVNQHRSNQNSDGDDATPTDALIFKTDLSGSIVYHRQVDNPSTSTGQSSKFLSAINKTSVGDPIAAGGDDGDELVMKYGATGAFSLTFSEKAQYSGSFLGSDPTDVSQIYEVNGGTDLVTMSMYIPIISFFPEFNNALHRMNASATSTVWAKKYTFGLAAILPRGQQTSDGGFLMTSTTSGGSWDYQVIKTDPNGDTPLTGCPPGTFSPSHSGGPTTIATPNYNAFSGTPAPNGLTVAVGNINPTQNVVCRTIECVPPPVASTVSASPNPICAGASTTITASGPGTNVSYNVYDAATGGTNLGSTPLVVSPGTTTSYFVETVDDSDPTCVSTSRVEVVVTVNPSPTVTPTSNSPICVGEDLNLSTNAVTGGTYSWTGPNGFTSSSQNPTINNATAAADGTYSLTVTANGCSTGPITTDVIVSPTPTATAGAVSTTICSGQDIELTANTVSGGTYSWTGPNGFTSSAQNPTISGAGVSADGTYSLEISIGSCTSNTATVDITVNQTPTAAASATSTSVCEGDDIELNAATVSGGTYSWTGPNGFTSGSQNPTINNATLAADGTYSLTVTVNGCTSTPSTVDITVSPTPTATANAVNTTICSGQDIELTANTVSGGTYSWTGPNGFTSSAQNPTINGVGVNADGTYSLEITLGSCTSNTATVDITVNQTPTASAGAVATSVCEGDDIELNAATVSGGTYSWTGPNGFTSGNQNPTINNATLAADGTYSLTVTVNGCTSTSSTIDITVSPTPTATANAVNTIICSGQDIELTANTVSGGTYSWTGPNGFTSSDQNPVISGVGTSADGIYSLEITIGSCSSNISTVDITVNQTPTAAASATSTSVCEGDDIELNAATVSGGTYSWTGPNGFTSGNQNPTINNATLAADGTYSLTVTVNGCTSTSSTVDVSVSSTPNATASAINTTICSGQDIELTANTVSGGTYSWTGPNGFTSSDQNPVISGVGTSADGTYSLEISMGSCPSNISTVDITVNQTPTAAASATSTSVCEGDDIELNTTTVAGATYSWTGPNGFTSTDQNPTISNATATETGTYSLTVTANSCSSASSDVVITVNAPATLTIVGTDITCNGEGDGEATVTPTGNGPFNYNWSPSGGNGATASGLASGSYTVVVTDDNGCESNETVTIDEPDEIVLTTSSTESECTVDDGTATVNASGGTGTYDYLWTPSGQTTATATGIGAGSYNVEVTDDNNCTANATVIVQSVNGPTVTIIDQQNVSCIGANDGFAEAEATGGTPGYSYSWSPSGGNQATTTGLGSGTFTVEVTDDAGCTAIATVDITEPEALTIDQTITDASCGQTDGAITVNVSGGTPSYTYDWTPNVGNTSTIGNLSGGSYDLTLTDANGCQITQTYNVSVSGILPINITPPSATIDAGESVDLNVVTDPGVSGESYTWTPAEGLSCTDCPNPNAAPDETTTYYVDVTTPDGCSAMDSIVIVVDQPCGDLFVPTIFSPNNDGNNDMLCVYGGCISSLEFQIYNRWGELIYTTNDNTECWDGTQNGDPVNTGVYVYKLNVTLSDGEEVQESGNVNVVR